MVPRLIESSCGARFQAAGPTSPPQACHCVKHPRPPSPPSHGTRTPPGATSEAPSGRMTVCHPTTLRAEELKQPGGSRLEWHHQQPIRLMCPPLRIATSPPYGQPMMWDDVPFSDMDILAAWAAGWDPVWVPTLSVRMTGRCGQSSVPASWQRIWTSTSSSSCGVHMSPDHTLRSLP